MANIGLITYRKPNVRTKQKNERIAEKFKASKAENWVVPSERFSPIDRERIYKNSRMSRISYGPTTTLKKSGCAVFAAHQGLRLKCEVSMKISDLAKEIAEKGYYCTGKGTYHVLFDRLGCKRVDSVQPLLNYLSSTETPVATLLVNNSIYFGRDTGRHFVNAVGLTNVGILIDDSESATRKTVSFDKLIDACVIAWIW